MIERLSPFLTGCMMLDETRAFRDDLQHLYTIDDLERREAMIEGEGRGGLVGDVKSMHKRSEEMEMRCQKMRVLIGCLSGIKSHRFV